MIHKPRLRYAKEVESLVEYFEYAFGTKLANSMNASLFHDMNNQKKLKTEFQRTCEKIRLIKLALSQQKGLPGAGKGMGPLGNLNFPQNLGALPNHFPSVPVLGPQSPTFQPGSSNPLEQLLAAQNAANPLANFTPPLGSPQNNTLIAANFPGLNLGNLNVNDLANNQGDSANNNVALNQLGDLQNFLPSVYQNVLKKLADGGSSTTTNGVENNVIHQVKAPEIEVPPQGTPAQKNASEITNLNPQEGLFPSDTIGPLEENDLVLAQAVDVTKKKELSSEDALEVEKTPKKTSSLNLPKSLDNTDQSSQMGGAGITYHSESSPNGSLRTAEESSGDSSSGAENNEGTIIHMISFYLL